MTYPGSDLYPGSDVFPGDDLPAIILPSPGPHGALILCDPSGIEIAELEVEHTIHYERSAPASVTFTLGYDQLGALDLLDVLQTGIPRLRAYRAGELIFHGFWAPQQETLDGTQADGIACEFRSPIARLETRFRSTAVDYTALDAGSIVWSLINDTNNVGDTGITQGAIQATAARTVHYDIGQSLADALNGLTRDQIADGFDYTETFLPGPDGLSAFNVWQNLGRDLTSSVQFEYGDNTLANVVSVERAIDLPVNRVILTGGTAIPTSIANDVASQNMFGIYMATGAFSGINDEDRLDKKAAGMLRPFPVQQITFQPDMEEAPQPIDDYWLGDTVAFRAVQDGLLIETDAQITVIEIMRDGDGIEIAHQLEFGAQIDQELKVIRRGRRVVFRHPDRLSGSGGKWTQLGGRGTYVGRPGRLHLPGTVRRAGKGRYTKHPGGGGSVGP